MFKELSLSRKLTAGFGVLLVALAITAVVAVFNISRIHGVVMDLGESHVPLMQHLAVIDGAMSGQENAILKYVFHKDKKYLNDFIRNKEEADQEFTKMDELLKSDIQLVEEGWLDDAQAIEKKHDILVDACQKLADAVERQNSYEILNPLTGEVEKAYQQAMELVDDFLAKNDKEGSRIAKIAENSSQNATMTIIFVGILALILGVLLAIMISRSITKPIFKAIENLSSGSEQMSSASEQLSAASQSISEGASEQASSLEEVSSSLEEMSSMTKQNAENAQQSNKMATDASTAAGQGKDAMARMSEVMESIKSSSDETAKIIKTIDEIAMQTNLLALNAAVEAARAGDAGRGFAVVAEEVRNLAQRSAEAAKNTAELIEGSQKNADRGVEASSEVNQIIEQIIEQVQKVASLIGEVSSASNEQSDGIDQVNTAVAQLDQVTQQNAGNAEESASASEELSSQAQSLNAVVDNLSAIVNGRKAHSFTINQAVTASHGAIVQQTSRTAKIPMARIREKYIHANQNRRMKPQKKYDTHPAIEVIPEQTMSKSDAELMDF